MKAVVRFETNMQNQHSEFHAKKDQEFDLNDQTKRHLTKKGSDFRKMSEKERTLIDVISLKFLVFGMPRQRIPC